MVIYSNSIINILCRGSSRVEGITLYPFIILRKEIKGTAAEVYVINHERIHIAQQAELLVLPFMAIYICEYMWGRIRGLSPKIQGFLSKVNPGRVSRPLRRG